MADATDNVILRTQLRTLQRRPVTSVADATDNVIRSLLPLIEALEYLGIKYYIGGSLASSAYGISRPTQDADVVADIH